MEEKNEIMETTTEVLEPTVEETVIESNGSNLGKGMAIGAVLAAGLYFGAKKVKKVYENFKAKKQQTKEAEPELKMDTPVEEDYDEVEIDFNEEAEQEK